MACRANRLGGLSLGSMDHQDHQATLENPTAENRADIEWPRLELRQVRRRPLYLREGLDSHHRWAS